MTRLSDLLADLGALPRAVQVTGVERLTPAFTRVTLAAESFRRTAWTPGAKLQIRLRSAFRTYTPIGWDGDRGATDLLAFAHGSGPAAQWFGRVASGETCQVFGPRRSIDLSEVAGPVVFVGDESSVALACALRTVTADVTHVLEARDPGEVEKVLTGLGFAGPATVVARTTDRAELLRRARDAAVATPFTLVVTGDAATVHAVRRDSRSWECRPGRVQGKAYWAEGRTGLD
ncbi:siderophore-interacting protein [Symbioplanes lichenis]|uniref:siderophore-interacting protein n=1 Tax=Symbioplanes lichenis TaxID=1629072 RepID=UPI00273A1495|nr:siderophore-interacting protein [Actinoplanes lichenis]